MENIMEEKKDINQQGFEGELAFKKWLNDTVVVKSLFI